MKIKRRYKLILIILFAVILIISFYFILNKKKDEQNNELYAKDSAPYMGYNPTLINNNVQSIVGNHRKSAFISLPVIVFILSAVLLIASIVILFVLD